MKVLDFRISEAHRLSRPSLPSELSLAYVSSCRRIPWFALHSGPAVASDEAHVYSLLQSAGVVHRFLLVHPWSWVPRSQAHRSSVPNHLPCTARHHFARLSSLVLELVAHLSRSLGAPYTPVSLRSSCSSFPSELVLWKALLPHFAALTAHYEVEP